MAVHQVDLDQAKERLPELIDEAARGEEVVITRADEPVARLVPFREQPKARRPVSAKGHITMSDDFDEPLDDFAPYMS